MDKRRWCGMAVLLLFMVAVLGGCGPAPEPTVDGDDGLHGTVPLDTANRAALADAYDATVDFDAKEIHISEYMDYSAHTITRIHALEDASYKEAVWDWIYTAREELADVPGFVTETARVDLGYLSIRLSVPDPREELTSGPTVEMSSIANRTAVFDLETGKQLALADLFYENVPVADLINDRLLKAVGNTELKRPFTGFPADYPYFGLEYNSYSETTQLVFYCDRNHPFWPYDILSMELACYASPAGNYYYDVSYEELTTDQGVKTMVPTVTINDGTLPEIDAAINAAIREMKPRLEQAEVLSLPYLSITNSRFSLYYLEVDTYVAVMAAPGCTYTCNLKTGRPVSLREKVPVDGERVYYAPREGLPIEGYTPPAGSVLSDFICHYGVYYATLTEPSGQRILVEFRRPPEE